MIIAAFVNEGIAFDVLHFVRTRIQLGGKLKPVCEVTCGTAYDIRVLFGKKIEPISLAEEIVGGLACIEAVGDPTTDPAFGASEPEPL